MQRERRLHPRYPATWELKGTFLLALEPPTPPGEPRPRISGQVADIGGGGLCLVTGEKAEPATAVRGEIYAPPMPVGIPTLLQVRWVHEDPESRSYRLGLQFLV
jgi:hypothetical protein